MRLCCCATAATFSGVTTATHAPSLTTCPAAHVTGFSTVFSAVALSSFVLPHARASSATATDSDLIRAGLTCFCAFSWNADTVQMVRLPALLFVLAACGDSPPANVDAGDG